MTPSSSELSSPSGPNPPAVGYSVEVVTTDGHLISLSVPDAAHVRIAGALQYPGPTMRPTLHIHEFIAGRVREIPLWPDKPRSSEG